MTALPCIGSSHWTCGSTCLSLRPNHRSGSRRTSTQNPLPEPRVGFEPARAYPAHAAPSRFSDHLRLLNHVARPSYRPDESRYVSGSRPSIVSASMLLAISGDRNKKHPLTRPRPLFAVWHRLSTNSLASPFGPFIVELFAFPHLTEYPNASRHSAWRVLPAHDSPRQQS